MPRNLELKVSACDDFQKAGELGLFEAYQVIKDYCEEKAEPKAKSKKWYFNVPDHL